MNQNPWYLERMVQYEQDRTDQALKQIRLEEEALKARVRHPGLLAKARFLMRRWVEARQQHATSAPRPLTTAPAKHQIGIWRSAILRGILTFRLSSRSRKVYVLERSQASASVRAAATARPDPSDIASANASAPRASRA